MDQAALADALKDFGAPHVSDTAGDFTHDPLAGMMGDFPPFAADAGEGVDFVMPPPPAPDIDAIVAEAVAAAREEQAKQLGEEHEADRQAERDRHQEEVDALQQQLSVQASAIIAERLQEMEDKVVELTTTVTARILGIALTQDLRKRSIEKLSELITEAIRDSETVRIRVRGTQSLYEALRAALPAHADHLDYTESPGFDLWITIDESAYETRLSEWSAMISEVLS